MTVKLEVGKQYRMRNGNWCFVVDRTSSPTYPFLIYIHGNAGTMSITEYGTLNERGEHEYDIISEWTEPMMGYINVYEGQEVFRDIDQANYSAECNEPKKRIACVKFTEGQFDD